MRRFARAAALLVALCLGACTASSAPATLIAPAASAASSAAAQLVVTLGDSVPAGTACDCDPFPDLYAHMLSPNATSDNLAKPGFTSDDVVSQITDADTKAELAQASTVLIMVGANDLAAAFDNDGDDATYQATAAQVTSNLKTVVTAIRTLHGGPVQIVVLGYWNVVKDGAVGLAQYGADGLATAVQATKYCNQALRQAADASGARYVTTVPVFKGQNHDQDPTSLLAADGDHPNAQGHQAIAQAVYAALPFGG